MKNVLFKIIASIFFATYCIPSLADIDCDKSPLTSGYVKQIKVGDHDAPYVWFKLTDDNGSTVTDWIELADGLKSPSDPQHTPGLAQFNLLQLAYASMSRMTITCGQHWATTLVLGDGS